MTKHSTTASGTPPGTSSSLNFQQLTRTPVIPDVVLKRHNAYCAIDTRYRSAARLQQALWLKANNITTAADALDETDSFLGSILTRDAARAGKNFVSKNIHLLAVHEWMFCEPDAAIDPERLMSNALTSMALCMNLIGPLRLNPTLATAVFRILFPDFVHTVERIQLEHSPSGRNRSDARWLMDRSAVDFAVHVTTPEGEPGIIYGETKLSEAATKAARTRDQYNEVSRQVRLYRDPESPVLRAAGVDQLWRYHMTSQLSVENGVAPRALFTTISPQLNREMQSVIQAYEVELLNADQREPDRVAFAPLTLETFIRAMAQAGAHDLAQALWSRYCDFSPVVLLAMQEYAEDTLLPDDRSLLPRDSSAPSSTPNLKSSRSIRRARTKSSIKDPKPQLADAIDQAVAS